MTFFDGLERSIFGASKYRQAGIDWSGSPIAPKNIDVPEFYVPGAVVVESSDFAQFRLEVIKSKYRREKEIEIKGYKIIKDESFVVDVLDLVVTDCIVVASVLSKNKLVQAFEASIFDKRHRLAPATGLMLIDLLSRMTYVDEIVVDRGDISEPQRRRFNSLARKLVLSLSQTPLRGGYPKHYLSEKSASVQIADVVCYVLGRHAAGTLTRAISRKVEQICNGRGNVVKLDAEYDVNQWLE